MGRDDDDVSLFRREKRRYERLTEIFTSEGLVRILETEQLRSDPSLHRKHTRALLWNARQWRDNPIRGPYDSYKRLLAEKSMFKDKLKRLRAAVSEIVDLEPREKKETKMVHYMLRITADLENLTDLQPQAGCDDPDFSYMFKVKCGNCGELSQKETCVSLKKTVSIPRSKGVAHLFQKCEFSGRDGTVAMMEGRGRPLTHSRSQSEKYAPLMLFGCRGYEPVDFVFAHGWKAESLVEGTTFENIDLSSGGFTNYDENRQCPVKISNLRATFKVVKVE